MASQVLSGSSNLSYTNNTGQNVRIIINYMATPAIMNWGFGSIIPSPQIIAIGRNLAFNAGRDFGSAMSANNGVTINGSEGLEFALPTELMLSSGQTFTATCGIYNVVVIPEAG